MFLLKQSTHRMLIRHDARIGHLYVPNLRARIPNERGGYRLVTNSLGFRSSHEFHAGRGERPRILLFGDSYAAGDNCSNEERFSDRLGELLDAEVYNYALSGSGTDQHLLIRRAFAHDVAADLMVLCVQVDSIRRIRATHRPSIERTTRRRVLVPKPYFTLEADGGLALHQVPVPLERPAEPRAAGPQADGRSGDGGNGRDAAFLRWYRQNAPLQRLRRRMPRDLARLQSDVYRLSGLEAYPEYRSPQDASWRLLAALIRQFRREVAPLPVLIVPIPSYHYFLHGAQPVYQRRFAELEDAGAGVHVVDVTGPLARLPWRQRRALCFRQDSHFSPAGHEHVARLIAGAIRECELLPAPAAAPGRPAVNARAGAAVNASVPRTAGRPPVATRVLGISCFYHNSAACLVEDGRIVAAAEEERFSRVKNDRRFPQLAVNYCLEEGGVDPRDLSAVVYYDNASLTFERIMHSQLAAAAAGAGAEQWLRAMPSWLRYKLHIPQLIRRHLQYDGLLLQEVHHRSHAASAFYPSPFDRAAILTVDGVGEWATASIGVGEGRELRLLREMRFPHSLGLLYSAFTQFTGFKVNSGEYKLLGLAPYGEPAYVGRILEHLVELKADGSVELNLEYFGFLHDASMTNERFAQLFGGPPRRPESRITRREMDLARSIQVVTEEAILRMARHAHELTGERRLCLAGGVALNCVANGRLLREGPFEDIWIQPAAGDSGGALGAALDVHHGYFGHERTTDPAARPPQGGSYWGPAFSADEIRAYLETHGLPHRELDDEARASYLAERLEAGDVVGHFSGRLEYGPRALGARSILGDARNEAMQAELNLKIKYRESFRPFAPSVLAERVGDYFELDRESPYMLLVAPVRAERRRATAPPDGDDLLPVVRQARSDIPAVTHVDYSARIQTVRRDDHPAYHDLIRRFEQRTGCAVVVNTSFNVRGEPIVCTPEDAYRCFMRTEMNVLALGPFVLLKGEQPTWPEGRGEGLESEDAAEPEPDAADDPLARQLRLLFQRDVVPLAGALQREGRLLVDTTFRHTATEWSACDDARPVRALLEIPAVLDTPDPDAARFVDAMTASWHGQPAAHPLRALLRSLVTLGLRHPPVEALDETVSDSVYVMF
jgi:carbamoyltransferase